jgi:Tfp pilus assembly protein PilX
MQAERAPVLGIALAVLLLVVECVGLLGLEARREHAQERVSRPSRDAEMSARLREHVLRGNLRRCPMGPARTRQDPHGSR